MARWWRKGIPEPGKHEPDAHDELRSAVETPLFEYGRGRRRLTVWPDGTLEGTDEWGTKRVSLVGSEAILVDYEGDDLPVVKGRGRVFAQQTVVTVRDRLGKTTQVSVQWAMPLKIKQQLEEVVAGFAGQVAVSLASAGARLLVGIAAEPPSDHPTRPSDAELRQRAASLLARLAADPDDGAALEASRHNPNQQAALRTLTTTIHHRAELDPSFHTDLVALVRQAEQSGPSRWLDIAAGAGLGLAAAAAGAIGWFLMVLVTDTQYGVVAVAVGLLVGKAVVIGSGAAYSRRLQLVSVGITLAGLIASEYLIGRHFLAAVVAEDGGGSVPVLLDPGDAIALVRDSIAADWWTLGFWALALWPAWRIPAPRTGTGEGLRLPSATSRRWQLAGLAAGAVVLGGLGVSLAMMATQDQLATDSGSFIGDLQIGQCYQEPEQDQLNAVPCSQPHDGEVFAMVPLHGQALPAKAELEGLADKACRAQFHAYVGVAFHVPKLSFGWWAPTTDSWANGDRTMTCTLETLDGSRLLGSKRNAGTRTAPKLQSVKVARTAHAGAFRIWIKRMTCGFVEATDLPPAKHGQYCAVEFTATNTELSPAWLHAVDQRLSVATGESFNGVGVGEPLWDHDVQPGERVATRLVFDLPRKVRPIQLRLQGYTGHDLDHDLGPKVTATVNLPPLTG